jgi:hypothetical protein
MRLNALLRDSGAAGLGARWPISWRLLAGFTLIGSLIELPLEWYSTFRIEQRFGFNRMTLGLWLADLAKGAAVGALIGLPLAALILWIMGASGGHVVVLGLAGLGGLQPGADGAVPDGHRATFQQVRAAA